MKKLAVVCCLALMAYLMLAMNPFATSSASADDDDIAVSQPHHSRWVGQSGYPSIAVGESTSVWVKFLNTGTSTWKKGTRTEVRLGVNLDDRTISNLGMAVGWPFAERPAIQAEPSVAPGGVATFTFHVRGVRAGTYTLHLRPVIDGVTWMEDEGVFLYITVPLTSSHDNNNNDKFGVDPNHRGLGALATWMRDAGEPQEKDSQQFGLYLQKHTLTSNIASAQAEITNIVPMNAADLAVLAFDVSGRVGTATFTTGTTPPGANGYCGAGAPRFVVRDTVDHFLGCAHGDETQDPVTGWWEIKFVAPFTQYPGFGAALTGTITRIRIVFDEGNDSGQPGDVVIDNIRVNDRVVGKPTDDGDDD